MNPAKRATCTGCGQRRPCNPAGLCADCAQLAAWIEHAAAALADALVVRLLVQISRGLAGLSDALTARGGS